MEIFNITLFGINFAPKYYWLMYLLSFIIWYLVIKAKNKLNKKELEDLVFFTFLGIILGGRIWYILIYNFSYYLANLWEIFQIWKWWMSFHGWFVWLIISTYFFCKTYKKKFLEITDLLALVAPIGICLGRIWNYLNWELPWFAYNWPLAVKINNNSYFPSTLLESFLEWFLLFIIIFVVSRKTKKIWILSVFFLIFYSIFRFISEFVRIPDEQIWYLWWFLTMWQLLSIWIFILWIFLYLKLKKEEK